MAHPEPTYRTTRPNRGLRFASTLWLLCSLAAMGGCMTTRTRELAALRADLNTQAARADELEQRLSAHAQAVEAKLAAREAALLDELKALRQTLDAHTALLAEQEKSEPEPAEEAGEDEDDAHRRTLATAANGGSRRHRRRAHAAKTPEEAPAEELLMDDPVQRVHALMADVASRLQLASESVPENDKQSRTQLGKARQKLVDADRAAAQKDYARAEELAQDAAELIAAVAPGASSLPR